MEEINLMEFFNYYLARIGYVIATILVVLVFGCFYSFILLIFYLYNLKKL